MSKYFEMQGQFAQNGVILPNNRFKGFIEMENEIYSYDSGNGYGKVNVQHFKGIQIDHYDKAQKSRLVLGALQFGEKIGQTMHFKKLVNDRRMTPLVYGLEQDESGKYIGVWMPELTMFASEEIAELTKFIELTPEQVKEMKIVEFLAKGFADTEFSTMPPQMQVMVESYEQTKKIIIRQFLGKGKTSTPKETIGANAIIDVNKRPINNELDIF